MEIKVWFFYSGEKMYSNIYEKIEKDIKKTDYYMRVSFLVDILYMVFSFILVCIVWLIIYYKTIGWFVFAAIIVFAIIIWYVFNFKIVYEISRSMCYKELDQLDALKRSDFFKVKTVFAIMRKLKETKPKVVDIIKKYGITTKDGLKLSSILGLKLLLQNH